MNDYTLLAIVFGISLSGGLFLLREAKSWRQRKDARTIKSDCN